MSGSWGICECVCVFVCVFVCVCVAVNESYGNRQFRSTDYKNYEYSAYGNWYTVQHQKVTFNQLH